MCVYTTRSRWMLCLALAPVQELAGQDLITFLLASFCPFCGSTQLASCRYTIIFHAPSSFNLPIGPSSSIYQASVSPCWTCVCTVLRCFNRLCAPSFCRTASQRVHCGWWIGVVCVFVRSPFFANEHGTCWARETYSWTGRITLPLPVLTALVHPRPQDPP